LLADSYTDIL